MSLKVLIFGATGFAGRYLANELALHNYEVYGCGRYSATDISGCETVYVCDITDIERVKAVVSTVKPDAIVNMAGISSVGLSWKIPQTTVDVNVKGALNILDCVRDSDSDIRILFIGSGEEYAASEKPIHEDDPLEAGNPYGISKLMLEHYCNLYRKHYGLKIHYVRAFNHTGIGQSDTFVIPSWCKQVAEISSTKRPGTMFVGNLLVERDFLDVRDVVRAYRLVLESDYYGEVFNVASGTTYSLKDILKYIISLSTQPIETITQEKLIRPAENRYSCGSREKIGRLLGWEPEILFKDTIKEIYHYFDIKKSGR